MMKSFKAILRAIYQTIPNGALKRNLSRILKSIRARFLCFENISNMFSLDSNYLAIERPLSIKNNEDFIFYGVIDWHFRFQRPQHLALHLSRNLNRVFYISPSFNMVLHPGFSVEKLDSLNEIYQIRLNLGTRNNIYGYPLKPEEVKFVYSSIGKFFDWAGIEFPIGIINHPNWADTFLGINNYKLKIYDCMDYHDGFGDSNTSYGNLEKKLFEATDLVTVTSDFLYKAAQPYAKNLKIIRNATEYEHFDVEVKAETDSKVIGYFGAIAEWFDGDLLLYLANELKNCKFVIIGNDTINLKEKFKNIENVLFIGEVQYKYLPEMLQTFDVCLLPFKVNSLTLATNPLKIYEYLSGGKFVVSSNLPECVQFGALIKCATSYLEFKQYIIQGLSEASDPQQVFNRKEFARNNSWSNRADSLVNYVSSSIELKSNEHNYSIIIVTYNNLELTKDCISSIKNSLIFSIYEIIIVDNNSSDGTKEYLKELSLNHDNVKIILNSDNRGFSAANNQGIIKSTGKYVILLNNDTYITKYCFDILSGYLKNNPKIGIIGPVTNNIGNEAKINIKYDDFISMEIESLKYTRANLGNLQKIRTLAFYCVMIPRGVLNEIGYLDESFGLGFFEDDDYCRRVEAAGYEIALAHDVFVHHHLSASFSKINSKHREELFNKNKKIYEDKWGKWTPHIYGADKERFLTAEEDLFSDFKHKVGNCNICGKNTYFYYEYEEYFRESLYCGYCKSTSRYRSLARGVLKYLSKEVDRDLISISDSMGAKLLRDVKIYDTQVHFSYEKCSYPLPKYLSNIEKLDVTTSRWDKNIELGASFEDGVQNQNLESLTFSNTTFDIVITSDVMEHVRLDNLAHHEIYRVLKNGGCYIFTVPHSMGLSENLIRVEVIDNHDPNMDKMIMEPEYHGDVNGGQEGVLSYRVYGRNLIDQLEEIGFEVTYEKIDLPASGILNTEIFICYKK